MGFILGLPRSLRRHDTISVVVDCLTKSVHFLPIHLSNSAEDLGVVYIREVILLHEVLVSIVSDKGPCFISLF